MRTSLKGVLEIAEHEGITPAPYLDSVGVWTFGVGHTGAAGYPNPAAMQKGMPDDLEAAIDKAIDLFRKDLGKYEKRVNKAITVPLEQHQFDALVSFDFNTGGIQRAKLTEAINRGAPSASQHFYGWLRPPEIRKRRASEKRLFDTGDYDHNGDRIPIWSVRESGKLSHVVKTISGAEMLDRMGITPRPQHSVNKGKSGLDKWHMPLLSFFRSLFGR